MPCQDLLAQQPEGRAGLVGGMQQQGSGSKTGSQHQTGIKTLRGRPAAMLIGAKFLQPQAPLLRLGEEQVLELFIERAPGLTVFSQPLLANLLLRHGVGEVLEEGLNVRARPRQNHGELILVCRRFHALKLGDGGDQGVDRLVHHGGHPRGGLQFEPRQNLSAQAANW